MHETSRSIWGEKMKPKEKPQAFWMKEIRILENRGSWWANDWGLLFCSWCRIHGDINSQSGPSPTQCCLGLPAFHINSLNSSRWPVRWGREEPIPQMGIWETEGGGSLSSQSPWEGSHTLGVWFSVTHTTWLPGLSRCSESRVCDRKVSEWWLRTESVSPEKQEGRGGNTKKDWCMKVKWIFSLD